MADELDALAAENVQLRADNAALGTTLNELTAALELAQGELSKRATAVQCLKQEVAQLKKAARRGGRLGTERN